MYQQHHTELIHDTKSATLGRRVLRALLFPHTCWAMGGDRRRCCCCSCCHLRWFSSNKRTLSCVSFITLRISSSSIYTKIYIHGWPISVHHGSCHQDMWLTTWHVGTSHWFIYAILHPTVWLWINLSSRSKATPLACMNIGSDHSIILCWISQLGKGTC